VLDFTDAAKHDAAPAPSAVSPRRPLGLVQGVPDSLAIRYVNFWEVAPATDSATSAAPPRRRYQAILGARRRIICCDVDTHADPFGPVEWLKPRWVVAYNQSAWLVATCQCPRTGNIFGVEQNNVLRFTSDGEFVGVYRIPTIGKAPASTKVDAAKKEGVATPEEPAAVSTAAAAVAAPTSGAIVEELDAYGASVSPDGHTLLVADYGNNRVCLCAVDTLVPREVAIAARQAGGGTAELDQKWLDMDSVEYACKRHEVSSWADVAKCEPHPDRKLMGS